MFFHRKVEPLAPDLICRGCTRREARIRSQRDLIAGLVFLAAALAAQVLFYHCAGR